MWKHILYLFSMKYKNLRNIRNEYPSISIFLTVVQCRSFTQAAKYLNFTQPTISNHINALEEEYGVILFTRDGKNVYLTQAGKNFVPIAQQLMVDYQKSQEVMRQFQKKNYSLKIGVSTQGINFYLLPVLLKLKRISRAGYRG